MDVSEYSPPFCVTFNVIRLHFAAHDPDTLVSPAVPYTVNDVVVFAPPDLLYPVEQFISAVGLFSDAFCMVQLPFVAEHSGVAHTAYNLVLAVGVNSVNPSVARRGPHPRKIFLPFVIFVFFAVADTSDDHSGNAHGSPTVHVIVAPVVPPTICVPVPIYPDPPFLFNVMVTVFRFGHTSPPLHEYPDGHDLHEFPVVNALELMV